MQLTMHDLRVRDYKLPDLDGDIATKSRNALLYIEQLASMTKRDVSKWDMIALFGRPNADGLVYDRNKINEIFFSQPELEIAAEQVPEKLSNAILQGHINVSSGRVATIESDIKARKRRIAENYRAIEDHLASLKQLVDKLEAAKTVGDDIKQLVHNDFAKVFGDGFFEYEYYDTSTVYLKTKPVTLTYKHKGHGVDITVPMGVYKVGISLDEWRIWVSASNTDHSRYSDYWGQFVPNKDNLRVEGYYHPHINSNGSVCWGGINIEDMIMSRNLYGMFAALHHVLTQYNHDSAYVVLPSFCHRFQDIIKYQQEGGSNGQEEEQEQEYCDDCSELIEYCDCE